MDNPFDLAFSVYPGDSAACPEKVYAYIKALENRVQKLETRMANHASTPGTRTCSECNFYKENHCANPLVINDSGLPASKSAGISVDSLETGSLSVGANFGCIHWVSKVHPSPTP